MITINCSVHKDEPLTHFCDTCNITLCSLCYTEHVKSNFSHKIFLAKDQYPALLDELKNLHSISYAKAVNPIGTQQIKLLDKSIQNLKDLIQSFEEEMSVLVSQFKNRHVSAHREICCKYYLQAKSLTTTMQELKRMEFQENYSQAYLNGKQAKNKHIFESQKIKESVLFPMDKLQDKIETAHKKFTEKFQTALAKLSKINQELSISPQASPRTERIRSAISLDSILCVGIESEEKIIQFLHENTNLSKNRVAVSNIFIEKNVTEKIANELFEIVTTHCKNTAKIECGIHEKTTNECAEILGKICTGNKNIKNISICIFRGVEYSKIAGKSLTNDWINEFLKNVKIRGNDIRICIKSERISMEDCKEFIKNWTGIFEEFIIMPINL